MFQLKDLGDHERRDNSMDVGYTAHTKCYEFQAWSDIERIVFVIACHGEFRFCWKKLPFNSQMIPPSSGFGGSARATSGTRQVSKIIS